MKIVIANGTNQAAYLIGIFKAQKHRVIVINSSKTDAQYLLNTLHVPVMVGNPWSRHVLSAAKINGADLFISLCDKDTDNFASCLIAKRYFEVDKCISLVSNPANVELYKRLGIDSAVSSTYLLGQTIKNESTVESVFNTLSLENDKIVIVEFRVSPKHRFCNHAIMDLDFPKFASIAAIYRNYRVIIPNGQVELKPRDKLLVVVSKEDEQKMLDFLKGEN